MKIAALTFSVGLLTVFFFSLIIFSSSNPVNAQTDDSYQPCSKEVEAGVDVLIMMDQSGSLRKFDPDGEKRIEALKLIREDFTGVNDFRLAMLGFEGYGKPSNPLAPVFKQASNQHPSDEDIERAVKDPKTGEDYQGDTDYKVAFDASLKFFNENSDPNSCRLLLFFTDGIFDPKDSRPSTKNMILVPGSETLDGNDYTEENYAEAFLNDICGVGDSDLKGEYEKAKIQTYAVLLSNAFELGLEASPHEKKMSTISLQLIRAFTGHADSDLEEIVEIEKPTNCSNWERPQSGEIIFAEDVEDLVNSLLLPLAKSENFVDINCTLNGTETTSEELPAGIFIEELKIYAFGGDIVEHPFTKGSIKETRLTLEKSQFKEKGSGWKLELKVDPRENETVSLECRGKRNREDIQGSGNFINAAGNEVLSLLDTERYNLKVEMGQYVGPFEEFTLESSEVGLQFEHHDDECRSTSSSSISFELLPKKNDKWEGPQLQGTLIPCHAKTMFGTDHIWNVEVVVPLETKRESEDENAPKLNCAWKSVITETTDGEFPKDRVKLDKCAITPGGIGETTVDIKWIPKNDLPGLWDFDQNKKQNECNEDFKISKSKVCDFEIESDFIGDLLITGDFKAGAPPIEGSWRVQVEWNPGDGSKQPVKVREQKIKIDPSSAIDSLSTGMLECDEKIKITNAAQGNEVPREPLKGRVNCKIEAPDVGIFENLEVVDFTLSIKSQEFSPSDAAESSEEFEWNFYKTEDLGKLSKDKSEILLSAGVIDQVIEFITDDELKNVRWDGAEKLILKTTWIWKNKKGELIHKIESNEELLSTSLDLRGRSNSATAVILALLITLLAIILSYWLLYWILVRNNRLPSPSKFWFFEKRFTVSLTSEGRVSEITEIASFSPNVEDLSLPTGDSKRGQWIQAGPFRVETKHSRFWDLNGLIRGGWGQITFQPNSSESVVVFLLPRTGMNSGIEAIDQELRSDLETAIREIFDDLDSKGNSRNNPADTWKIGGEPPGPLDRTIRLLFNKAFLFAIPDSSSGDISSFPFDNDESTTTSSKVPPLPGEKGAETGGLPPLPGETGGLPPLPGETGGLPPLPD